MKTSVDQFKDFVQFVKSPPEKDRIIILEQKLIQIYAICLELPPKQGKTPKGKNEYFINKGSGFKELPRVWVL